MQDHAQARMLMHSYAQSEHNKKVLQAHVDGALLRQSATHMFVYEVSWWRMPMILTTNTLDLSGLTDEQLDWADSNCVVVHVDQPVNAGANEPQQPES